MDKTSSSSNQYQSGLIDLTGAPTFPSQASYSDDELILAANRPKKRAGRTKFKETRHPVYRGVRSRNTDRWVCELREPINQTRIWLGTYPTAEMAARAHDVAALALRGQSACLNFADSVSCLPVPPSKEAKDIRKTAMEAAEAFRPRNSGKGGEGRINNVQVFYGASGSEEASMVGEMNTTLVSVCYNEEEEGMEGMLNSTPENVFYHDEEAMFDMPGLMQDMAEGMMLSPPPSNGDLSTLYEDSVDTEFPLWSHSV